MLMPASVAVEAQSCGVSFYPLFRLFLDEEDSRVTCKGADAVDEGPHESPTDD